jgi:hypothetical protein
MGIGGWDGLDWVMSAWRTVTQRPVSRAIIRAALRAASSSTSSSTMMVPEPENAAGFDTQTMNGACRRAAEPGGRGTLV